MSNTGAIGLRKQIEIDRQVEIDEVNRKFTRLLEMVETAYGVGNLMPKAAAPRKPRTTKAAPTTVVPTTNGDTIPVPAATDTPAATNAEQDASYENSAAFHDVNIAIREFLLTQNEGAGKAAILEATGLVESVAMVSIKFMVDNGELTRTGAKRGTKYLVRTAFDAPADNTADTDTDGT